VTMLGTPRFNGHKLPVVSFDRKRHAQYRIARLNYAQRASYDRHLLVRLHLTAERVCQTTFYEASGLVEEFIHRVYKSMSILVSSSCASAQATSAASQDVRRS